MSISRLQLAAALLEYDNIDAPPTRQPVSHRDSALFKPYKPRPLDAIPISQSHEAYSSDRQSRIEYGGSEPRRERTTSGFSTSTIPAPPPEHVNLNRWDLPSHLLSPDVDGTSVVGEKRAGISPPLQNSTAPFPRPLPISSPLSDRINSVHLDVLDGIPQEETHNIYEEANEAIARSQRVQSMYNPVKIPLPPSPASTLTSFQFATHGDQRRGSMDYQRPGSVISGNVHDMMSGRKSQDLVRPSSRLSRSSYDVLRSPGVLPQRPGSSYSMLDQPMEQLHDDGEDLSPNPFALPPPPAELGSRFDPKTIEAQRKSIDLPRPMSRVSFDRYDRPDVLNSTHPTLTEQHLQEYLSGKRIEETPNPLKGREFQTFKNVPTAEEYGKPLRAPKYGPLPPIDRHSLLRPKTLIMPSFLSEKVAPPSPPKNIPEGYTLGDKPLPPGSRNSILSTDLRGRPGLPLSLSQKTFRSSLIVGGRREEEEYWVGGATEDGQVGVEYAGEPDPMGPVDRRPGKLYGKSLMDQLEARKSAMKGKQRTFAGDMRPAMMARGAGQQELNDLPADHSGQPLNIPRQPLLTIDSSGDIDLTTNANPDSTSPVRPTNRITKSRSVFGVDTIWEKEMTKLKVIQEAESRAAAAREAKEAAEQEALEAKKKKKKGSDWKKKKAGPEYGALPQDEGDLDVEPEIISPLPQVSELPPQISYSPEKAPKAQIVDPKTDEVEGDEDDLVDVPREDHLEPEMPNESSGDLVHVDAASDGSESDEDVPLSRLARAKIAEESDSEEDVPLSNIKRTISPSTSLKLPALGEMGTGSLGLQTKPMSSGNESDEDDVPLMIRKTVHLSSQPTGPVEDVEDDLPLGFKHADAVVRQTAGQWRNTMTSPQFGNPAPPSNPMMGWGCPGMPPNGGMMGPYGYNAYSMPPNMGMGYPSPGMPNSMMGWTNPSFMQLPNPQAMPMGLPQVPVGGVPEQASKNIDNWRKEVAIQPVPTGGSSIKSGSAH